VTDGALRLTPEAGTMKSRKPRTVPLHEHLIEQGFLAFVKANGSGPLFYNEAKKPATLGQRPWRSDWRKRSAAGFWRRSAGKSRSVAGAARLRPLGR
jgi:hypothetical protein